MLAKQHRFSFKNTLPKRIIQSKSFSLRFDKNNVAKLQVAVVVSKKVDKRAVVRNKIKRKILEAVRKNIDTNTSLDLVFYAKSGAASSENLEKDVSETLLKIK